MKALNPGTDIVHRWRGNPLIGIGDIDFRCSDIRSCGVAACGGNLILLVTIEHLSGYQAVHIAQGKDMEHLTLSSQPFLSPALYDPNEAHGVMDARITRLEDIYYIVYVANGEHGYRLGLARTGDFKKIEKVGFISEPDTKAGALFPVKMNDEYVRLERPGAGSSIWIAFSPDLIHWGRTEIVLSPRAGYWDATRIGTGPPPMEIDEGWLLIYYGVKDTSSGPLFRLGAAILDRNDPTTVIGRANVPILAPREYYERIGDIPNIVFCTGAEVDKNRKLTVFYGAANSCLCVGDTTVDEIVRNCAESKEEF